MREVSTIPGSARLLPPGFCQRACIDCIEPGVIYQRHAYLAQGRVVSCDRYRNTVWRTRFATFFCKRIGSDCVPRFDDRPAKLLGYPFALHLPCFDCVDSGVARGIVIRGIDNHGCGGQFGNEGRSLGNTMQRNRENQNIDVLDSFLRRDRARSARKHIWGDRLGAARISYLYIMSCSAKRARQGFTDMAYAKNTDFHRAP